MVDLRFRDIVRFSCGCNMVADFELKKLVKPLQDWFDGHARVLPWRDDPKAYKVWISEIMLQQTRVEAVKPYFARFMEALPDVEALAACPEDRYLKLWEGLVTTTVSGICMPQRNRLWSSMAGQFRIRWKNCFA